MRVPFFRDHPTYRPPQGPLLGHKVLFLAPVLDADLPALYATAGPLHERGVDVRVASECHGEVRGGRQTLIALLLFPNLLTCEVRPPDYDALVVAGGTGAEVMVEDQLSREVATAMARLSRPIFALGEGRLVLQRAGLSPEATDPQEIVLRILSRLGLPFDRLVPQPA
jgi:putative intracellular protease/amidase